MSWSNRTRRAYYLWLTIAFPGLGVWVIHQVIVGKLPKGILITLPVYALLSWSFYYLSKRHKD